MDVKQLAFLQSEFAQSRRDKRQYYHRIWDAILVEYGLDTVQELVDHARRYRVITPDSLERMASRVPTLNVAVRKTMALMGFQTPEFMVDNQNPLDEPIAAVLEAAMKHVVEACDWPEESDALKLDLVLYGTCIAKVGFGSEFVYDAQAWSAPVPQAAQKLLGDDKDLPYGVTTEYTNYSVKEGFPMMTHVPIRDMVLNLGVRCKKDIRRYYHIVRRPLVDVLHDSRYDNVAKRQVTVRRDDTGEDRWYTIDPFTTETEYVECIEMFDATTRQFCVFTENAQRPLIDWTPFTFPIESPFEFGRLIPMDGTVWGQPYPLLQLGSSRAINRCRAAINEAVERDAKTLFFYDSDKWSSEEVERAQMGRNGEWVGKQGLDPSNLGLHVFTFNSANPEVMQLAQVHQQDQAFASGLTDPTRGARSSGATATEVQVRQESQNVTVEDFAQRYERFWTKLGRKTMQLMLAKWNPDRLVKVVGPNENIFFWTKINVERVQGSFTMSVVAGSALKRDRAVQRQQWTEMLPAMGQIYNFIMAEQQQGVQGPVDWHEVLRETLDQYDPVLARRVLRPQNTAMLVMRLMMQHNIMPLGVSPELARQVQQIAGQPVGGTLPPAGQEGLGGGAAGGGEIALGGGAMGPGAGAPVAGATAPPLPATSTVNPQGGQIYSATAGMAGRV